MRTKLLAVLAVLAVIGSLVVSTQAVLADGWAMSNSMASGPADIAISTAGSGAESWSSATAATDDDYFQSISGTPGGSCVMTGSAITDSESQAMTFLYANTPETGNGSVSITGVSDAADGAAMASMDVYAYVNDRAAESAAASVNVNILSSASGLDAFSYVDADQGYVEATLGIGIDPTSSGQVVLNVVSSAAGELSNSYIGIGAVNIYDDSSGSVDAEIQNSCQGTGARVQTGVELCSIFMDSSGAASVDIMADASGDGSFTYVEPCSAAIGDCSSGDAGGSGECQRCG